MNQVIINPRKLNETPLGEFLVFSSHPKNVKVLLFNKIMTQVNNNPGVQFVVWESTEGYQDMTVYEFGNIKFVILDYQNEAYALELGWMIDAFQTIVTNKTKEHYGV